LLQLSILNAANLFGRTIPPAFASKFGAYNIFVFCEFVMGIVLLCMAAIKNATGVVVIAIFYGLFGGGGKRWHDCNITAYQRS
jgi:hypothetical protein